MQNSRKISALLSAGAALLLVSTFSLASSAGRRHGTDILHLFSRTTMTTEGAATNASGRVELAQNKQGKANNQNLAILLRNLETNATYQLLTRVGDTNFTQVSEFQADAAGRASLIYRKVGSSQGHGKGLGRGKSALPAALDPVSQIRELAISLNSTQTVLRADLTAPDKLAYLIKRDLGTTNGVDASLRIFATVQRTQFRLAAFGLTPEADYLLALNGGIVQTNSADAKGRLLINSLVESPVDILDLHSVALWDGASNVVVQTTLP
jgi:hypothetical protein